MSDVSIVDPELKQERKPVQTFNTVEDLQSCSVIDRLIAHRSSWTKLKLDVAWILRFITYLRNKVNARSTTKVGCIEVSELQLAETVILRHVQRQCFLAEFNEIAASKGKGK